MQLSVSSQASHLWICFFHCLTQQAAATAYRQKHRDDREGISSLRGISVVEVDGLPNASNVLQAG